LPPSIADGPQESKDQWVFLQATAWPDIARNQPRYHHGAWHYVNFPHFVSTKDKEGLDLSHINLDSQLPVTVDNEDGLNILQAILLNEQVLNSNSSTDPQKAIGLCWLMHLIGDIHQPLHSTALFTTGVFSDADGDRGGNQIEVDGTNLHAYWDNLLGNPTTIGNIGARAQGALDKFGERGAKATHFMNALHWAQESHHLAKEAVYTKEIFDVVRERDDDSESTIRVSLTPEYKSSAESIATQRIVEAGFRLARAIEEVVGNKHLILGLSRH
jgi:S1/P1 Nuclease